MARKIRRQTGNGRGKTPGSRRTAFKPGKSGNPKGRPEITPTEREFRELCKAKAPAALLRMEARAKKKGGGVTAQRADEYIIDRGFGRAKQEVSVSGTLEVKDGRAALAQALGLSTESGGEALPPGPTEP